ncbi:TonB-dependent receptor [Flavobacterium hercynium]|uniref:Collagen-binding protein n=1 Tax=Flavobacterium hercynium TaxID=387094 RepID=A0A226GZ73_9FLAO|nr:TonB-dependent receptor [Flavobacterium hercynium]OXA87313.1 collagen-binding protein [Flavobacterium hercynium]SMP19527.1 TonB-dependent Receptor Plug Domain [Flavobacterium hercynium]
MLIKKITLLIFLTFTSLATYAQQKFTVSGTISDSKSNETLIGVNIYVPALKIGTTTNEYGFYSLTMPEGEHEVEISYVGYESIQEMIVLNDNSKNNFSLKESGQELQEVVISSKKGKLNIRTAEMSTNKLSITAIKKMPVVMGEVDILKSLLLLPGVTNAGEGASGFNVRGGGADQNLILLDEAPVFSTSHLFGFFSVFNPDVIKDLKLYKGGIPAKFGGRASSVLDIHQKDGNSKGFHASGGIGLISSRLLVEGPLVKDKASFLIGGRASYLHLFLKLSEETKNTGLYFYDLNTKFNYKINDDNSLYLSGYFGRDVLNLNNVFNNTYGNSTLNLRWNHLFSDKLFSNLSLVYGDYNFGLGLKATNYQWDSGIKNYNIKYDLKNYISDSFKLNYGLNGIYYEFNPGTITGSGNSTINLQQLDKKYAFEPAAYVDAETKISEKITASYGLRYSLFYRLGGSTINYYDNNNPLIFNSDLQIYEKAKPVATKYFNRNEVVQNYNNLEPRFGVSYQLSDDAAIKANYNRMAQYLQLISNTSSPTPLDVWMPSDTYIKPQIADQVALGYFKNINDGTYTLEVESYYKKIKNRLDYIDGANLIANNAIEQIVLNGQMRSYGVEFLLKKNEGKLNGWISYTLSKSEQQTPGRTAEEIGINDGKWYNSVYDKRHNLAITSSYTLNEKWSFGTNFVLQSGQPVTYPTAKYEYIGETVPDYSLRNQYRLPAYHHLDISATLTPTKNKYRNWKGEWVFSIYNLYGRKNAASVHFADNPRTGDGEAVRTSIYGIVPSITYNFKF